MRYFSQTTDQRVFLMASINAGEYLLCEGFRGWHYSIDGYCREAVATVADVLGVDLPEFERLVNAYVEDPCQYHPSRLTPAQERSAESVAQLCAFIRTHKDSNRLRTETKSTFVVDLNTGESITIVASF